ncbi:hypothetical protein CXT99_08750 [Akkermansia muciniphila]|uniref:RHS repeat domain-containing protein n=1 Tax=Akkermansia muciniphila TaxID=239935 RepID=UPI000C99BA0C|nr:hypothetical protein CXT99_08750 [Akkermansia muciniphila]
MVCIICFPIQYVHIFRSCRRMPVNIQTSGIRRNGINVVKNGFLFYGGVFPVKIITAFLRMSTILIYILVFSPVATRVLAMTRWEANGTQVKEHLYCMHDAMKNVTSLFGEARGRRALYEYRPYGGLVTSEGNMAQENKFRFSCEYMDDELGLIYYNYRHLNPHDGRWISRDPIKEEGGWNLFAFVGNSPIHVNDNKGLSEDEICNVINKNNKTIDEVRAGFDPILQKIGDLIHIWDLLKKFNSNPANHKGEKITVILKNSDLIIESGRNSFFLIRTPLKDCVRKLCFSRRGFGGSRNKGERNLAGSPAGTPNEFKKMKPDPNNPDRVLMKDPNGKTISKPKPNGFDEFWKNKHN